MIYYSAQPVQALEAPLTIEQKVDLYAEKYGVSKEVMHKVIKCESGYNPDIQSQHPDPTGPNGKEDSWGLVQIHLPAHPQITREQATSTEFALNFLAENLAKGNGKMWSCWKKYYASLGG